MDKDKKLNIISDPSKVKTNTYNAYLIKFDKDHFEIHFADRTETNDTITVEIENVISIKADEMMDFCLQIAQKLAAYEKIYKNGLGFKIDDADDENK